ncbi:hypothetical protein [Streptomyces sp. NPDC127092]|uniref:hypothetical protein n=1 Tax=Streptomyces sp. NPDC127092 TaxID=3347135 RepID=UPI00366975B5
MLSGTWKWASFGMGLLPLAIGLSGLLLGKFDGNEFTVVIALVIGVWVVATAPFAGVRVNDRGVLYRGILKRKRFTWDAVQSVTVEYVGGNGLLEAEMPVVKTKDGSEIPLLILAGYTSGHPRVNRRVRQQAAVIQREWELAIRRTD